MGLSSFDNSNSWEMTKSINLVSPEKEKFSPLTKHFITFGKTSVGQVEDTVIRFCVQTAFGEYLLWRKFLFLDNYCDVRANLYVEDD